MALFQKSLQIAFVSSFLLLTLTGCDQIRNTMQSVFKPQENGEAAQNVPTGKETVETQSNQAVENVPTTAVTPAESMLSVARSAARSGNVEQALVYLQKALEMGAIQPTDAMLLSDFESLRTDPRFLNMVAGVVAKATSTPTPTTLPASTPKQNAPLPKPNTASPNSDVSAEVGEGGISARAGDVSVRIAP
jgi:hypothetical protein